MPPWAGKWAPRDIGLAGAAGTASGTVILSVMNGGHGGLLLAYVATLPLMLIGLTRGVGLMLAAMAVGAALLSGFGLAALPAFLVIGALPAFTLVATALLRLGADGEQRRWLGAGSIATVTCVVACLVMGLVCLALVSPDKTIEASLRAQATPMFEAVWPDSAPEVKSGIIAISVAVMPAMVGMGWFAMTLLNGLAGQFLAGKAGGALRPSPKPADFAPSLWLAAGSALALGVSMTGGDGGYVAQNAALVLLLPFLVAGLVDIHLRIRPRPYAGLWLGLFYGVFFALFGWAAMAVTLWGLVRQYVRSRRPEPALNQED